MLLILPVIIEVIHMAMLQNLTTLETRALLINRTECYWSIGTLVDRQTRTTLGKSV
jgi:hypothetical protein